MRKTWDLSCLDWQERLRSGHPPIPDLPLDKLAADQAVNVFNRLRLHDVVGTPTRGEAGGEWFRQAVVRPLFGSIDPETGERFIREIFLLVPKKNDKTGGGAAVMMTALFLNKRPRGEFLLVAPSHAVAELAFNACVGMIEEDDRAQLRIDGKKGLLKHMFRVQPHLKKITQIRNQDGSPGTGATLRIRTFDQKIVVGTKTVGIMLDEFWELARNPRAANIAGQLRGGQLPIPEAFRLIISTQSDEPPVGIFKEELSKARLIRDGHATGLMLPVIYEYPKKMMQSGAWRLPENWYYVNPNLTRSITIDGLQEIWSDAEAKGDPEIRRAASQHFNIEIGMGLHSDRWAGADYWEKRADKSITLDYILEHCEVVVVGIDGGGADDLFGLVVMGRETGTRRWLVWSHGWCLSRVLDRRKSIASTLLGFETANELTICDDNIDEEGTIPDIPAIVEIVKTVNDAGLLACVAMDPEGLGALVDALAEIEITQADKKLEGVSQGYRLMNAIKSVERKLVDGTLRHSNNGLMNWCVENLKIEPTATAIRATKQFAGDRKIDLAMAMFDAADRMSMNPAAIVASGRVDDFLSRPIIGNI
jgi:phage terminase large subunit-like protein